MADDGTLFNNPDDVQANQNQQIVTNAQGFGGSAATQMNGANTARAFSNIIPSAQVQKAKALQSATQGALANFQPDDGDDQITTQIKRLKDVYSAVAPIDTNTAMRVANQLVKLQEAQNQQTLLKAQTGASGAQQVESTQKSAIERATAGTFVVGSSDGQKEYGTVSMFDDNGQVRQGWQQDLAKLQAANPNATVMTQQQWGSNKANTASIAANAKMQIAMLKASTQADTGLTDDGLKQLVGESVLDPTALSRQPANVRSGVANMKAQLGVSPVDEAIARVQKKNLESQATAIGRREGNIKILQTSVAGAGDQVLTTLGGVDRGNVMGINSAVAAGKTAFSDPGEARYAAALQSFVNEYSRVISGGGSQTTDAAKQEAHELLNKAQGPDAVRAVVDQLAKKELGVLNSAGATAVEMLSHPEQYSAMLKIQTKLGLKMMEDAPGAGYTPPTASAAPPAAGGSVGGVRVYDIASGTFK